MAQTIDPTILEIAPDHSPWKRSIRRFFSHRLAVLGLGLLGLMIVLAVFAEFVAPYEPNRVDVKVILQPPSTEHVLGTDRAGRDVFSRLVFAARVSLSVGIVAVGIYIAIGLVLGGFAGLVGGRVDNIIMRITDVVLAFPTFILIVVIAGMIGPNIFNIMWIIGIFGWPGVARLVRGQVLVLRELDYVVASRALGASNARIILRHLLPNSIGPITVAATLGVAGAILTEAGLSFLGLGVQQPNASWGSMLSDAKEIAFLAEMPWMWVSPGVAVSLAVLSINFIGDGLRDAFDVRGSARQG